MKSASTLLLVIASALLAAGCRRVKEISPKDVEAIRAAAPIEADENDYPWWRGIDQTGHAVGPPPPIEWSEDKNVIWKTDVPGKGHATPTIWGDRIFIATSQESDETQSLLCYSRDDGRLLWPCELHRGGFMHTHTKNTHASATPACDGERVFAVNMVQRGIWVTAVNFQGKIVWQKMAGPFKSRHGYGSSPVLYKSLVIVAGDGKGSGFLAALDRASGKIVWRVKRGGKASFATPVIARLDDRDQLLLHGHDAVISYDPASGKQLWKSRGPATTTANTIAWHEGENLVFASGGWPQHNAMAIRADGSGEVVWEMGVSCYVPSPLVVGDRLYLIQDEGIVRCLDAKTGEKIFIKRLGGNYSASPVLSGGNIYLPDEAGEMRVFQAGEKFELLAKNKLGDRDGFASPVICGGKIYLRTRHRLYCLGNEQAERPTAKRNGSEDGV